MPFEISESLKKEMIPDWISQIEKYNNAIEVLKRSKVDFMALPNPPDAKNKEQLNRNYNVLMQAHLRRFLCLIDSMELTWNTGRLLPCAMMGRACMESAATTMLINSKLEKHIIDKTYNKAYYWIASHMLSVRKDIEVSGYDDLKLQSTHIMSAIRYADSEVSGYLDAYEWLSEFLHPNNFGVFSSFCEYRPDIERATFRDSQEIARKAISNCMTGLISVPIFARACSQVGEIGKGIVATDWGGDDALAKLF